MEDRQDVARNIEIVRGDRFTVIRNLNYPDQQRINELSDIVGEGIPETWVPINMRTRLPVDASEHTDILVDDLTKPKFLAKRKRRATIDQVKKMLAHPDPVVRRLERPLQSLMSEFNIVPKVARILQQEKAQEIIIPYGFINIELIQPLLGLIEKATGEKTIFYDFIDAETLHSTLKTEKNAIQKLPRGEMNNLTNGIADLFRDSGIIPGDISPFQFMTAQNEEGNDVLYLIDIEGYIDTSQRISS